MGRGNTQSRCRTDDARARPVATDRTSTPHEEGSQPRLATPRLGVNAAAMATMVATQHHPRYRLKAKRVTDRVATGTHGANGPRKLAVGADPSDAERARCSDSAYVPDGGCSRRNTAATSGDHSEANPALR